jgi:hypothetical protein
LLPVATTSSIWVLVPWISQFGGGSDGQRKVLILVACSVWLIRSPTVVLKEPTDQFAALYSDCCSMKESNRPCVPMSPFMMYFELSATHAG